MKNQTVCVHVATVSARILGHGEAWIQKLLGCWRLEDPKMRYRFLDDFDLWCCFNSGKENLTIRLLYKKLLAIEGVSWRHKKGHVSRLQCCGQNYQVSQIIRTVLSVSIFEHSERCIMYPM